MIRFRLLALGLALAGAVGAWVWWQGQRQEILTARERVKAAEALGLTLARQVRSLELSEADARALADSLGSKVLDGQGKLSAQVRLTQRWRAQAERRPAAVTTGPPDAPVPHEPTEPVEVAQGCTLSETTMEGGCTAEVFMLGDRPAARFSWSATARGLINGEPFSVESPERPADSVQGEASKPEPAPLKAMWAPLAGLWAETDQAGVSLGLARWGPRKRIGWWGMADYAVSPADVHAGALAYEADRFRIAAGVSLRIGRK